MWELRIGKFETTSKLILSKKEFRSLMSIGEQGEPRTVKDFRDFWIYMGALERGRSNT